MNTDWGSLGSTSSTSKPNTSSGTVVVTTIGNPNNQNDDDFDKKLNNKTSKPKGSQNSKVKKSIQNGKSQHSQMDYGPNTIREFRISIRSRADAIDIDKRIIYELKPNNPRAITREMKQLDRYIKDATQRFGGNLTGILKLYD